MNLDDIREKRQLPGVKPRTPLAWAASVLPLTHNSQIITNLYFCLITSKFIYFQHGARCSEHLEWENHSAWIFFLVRKISSQTLVEFWWLILSGYQVCDCGIQYHLCSTCRGFWGLMVVQLSWLSGRALETQARDVLGSTPDDCAVCTKREYFCKLQHASVEWRLNHVGLTYLPTLTITTLSSRYLLLLVLESGLHLMTLQNSLVIHN